MLTVIRFFVGVAIGVALGVSMLLAGASLGSLLCLRALAAQFSPLECIAPVEVRPSKVGRFAEL